MLTFFEDLITPKSNLSDAAKLLVDLLHVKITKKTLEKDIKEHPDYPSLLSISDVLKSYGIQNMAIRLAPDEIKEIPTPFITSIRGNNSNTNFFTVVIAADGTTIRFYDPHKYKWKNIPQANFIKKFTGIALLAEVDDSVHTGEKEYDKGIQKERREKFIQQLVTFFIPSIVLMTSILAFIKDGMGALLPSTFLLLTFIGSIIGTLLIWYELDHYNPLLQQICSSGRKVNCTAVLQSKGAKIAGISWSIIGFSYFICQLLILLAVGLKDRWSLFSASWLNVIALPYLIFSVYYQWKVLKQWCILCLFVQLLISLQLVVALAGNWHSIIPLSSITSEQTLSVLVLFFAPFISSILLISALQRAKEAHKNKNELQRLKHSREIFEALLSKQKAITEPTKDLGITLGNPNAQYKVIKVCNPYCGPCAQAHRTLEELLNNNNDLQIQIIFTATNDEEDYKAPPVRHLLAVAEQGDEKRSKQALNDWYLPDDKIYEVFSSKYLLNGELQKQSRKIEAMSNWCDKMEVSFTPTFFISLDRGKLFYQLPSIYSINDLKYFLTV